VDYDVGLMGVAETVGTGKLLFLSKTPYIIINKTTIMRAVIAGFLVRFRE